MQYLTDKALPTKQEIAAVYKLHADIQPCRKIVLEGAAKTSACHGAVLIGSFSASDKLWVEFASGHMTWGKFNSERQSIIQQSAQQQAEVNTRIASQLQNQHQVEIEQRQRAAAAMQQWAYQQQVLENQRQAITAQRDAAATAWKPGQSGNPKGRPKGSRNKLSEEFIADLHESWKSLGKAALVTAAWTDPVAYVRVVASLIPRELEAPITPDLERMSNAQLEALIARGIEGGLDPAAPG